MFRACTGNSCGRARVKGQNKLSLKKSCSEISRISSLFSLSRTMFCTSINMFGTSFIVYHNTMPHLLFFQRSEAIGMITGVMWKLGPQLTVLGPGALLNFLLAQKGQFYEVLRDSLLEWQPRLRENSTFPNILLFGRSRCWKFTADALTGDPPSNCITEFCALDGV